MRLLKKLLRNRNAKVRLLQVMNFFLLYFVVFHFSLPLFLLALVVYFLMFCLGINIGVHRYFTHRSFKTYKPFEHIFIFLFTISTVGSTIAWVGMHRKHHKFSDTEKDPHTPVLQQGSFWKKIIRFLKIYFGFWDEYSDHAEFTNDIRNNSLHKFFHHYYLGIILTYIVILYLISPVLVVWAYALPASMVFHAASLVVTYGHTFGHAEHDTGDSSKSSFLLHFVTCGEGLHNEHHAFPHFYKHKAPRWYMFDLPGFLIEILFKKGTSYKMTEQLGEL